MNDKGNININDDKPSKGLNPSYFIYALGVFGFGYFYSIVEKALGGGLWFFVAAIAYIICLRFIGDYIGTKIRNAIKS